MPILRSSRDAKLPLPRFSARARSARARCALALAAAIGLAGCAGEEPLSLPVPPNPNVPDIGHDSYPTLGTTGSAGRPTLSDRDKARLQSDLERLAREREGTVRTNIERQN